MTTPNDFTFKYDKRNEDVMAKIAPDEPRFILRAQDELSSYAIQAYADAVKDRATKEYGKGNDALGDSLMKQALGCMKVAGIFVDWQQDHPDRVKLPD